MPIMKKYTIKMGDTLQSIAQTLLQDTSKWVDLALLNNLDYPFISDSLTTLPNVKSFGDTIFVPISVDDNDTTELLLEDPDFASLGSDFYLKDGDLDVDINGDIRLVSGIDCQQQDLVNKLSIELGTLPYHPNSGSRLNAVIGNKTNKHWLDKATVELTRTFKTDPRVVDVKDVEVVAVSDQIHIKCTIVTITGVIQLTEQL